MLKSGNAAECLLRAGGYYTAIQQRQKDCEGQAMELRDTLDKMPSWSVRIFRTPRTPLFAPTTSRIIRSTSNHVSLCLARSRVRQTQLYTKKTL